MKTQTDSDQRNERLRKARLAAGFKSARSAASTFGWPYPTYAGHENGQRRFNRRDADIYGQAYRVDPAFLLTGKVNENLLNNGETSEKIHGIKSVPLLDVDHIATFEGIMNKKNPVSPTGRQEPLPGGINAGPRSFAITIGDMAMSGGKIPLAPGMIGYFDPDAECRTGDIVIAKVRGYPMMVVRTLRLMVGKSETTEYHLAAHDADFQSFSSADHGINLVGKLVGVWMPVVSYAGH